MVYRTNKRLKATGSIDDKKRLGRPRSVRTPQLIKTVKARFLRNPRRSANKMARELKVSRSTLLRVINDDMHIRPYKRRQVQGLTPLQTEKRFKRSKVLLERYAREKIQKIIFSDEKLFGVEEQLNSQNDRIYAASFEDIPEHLRIDESFKNEQKIMVWCGVSYKGKLPMVFIEPGTKVNATFYINDILENVVKVQGQLLYNNSPWTFQQDSAPAHSAKISQKCCMENLPDFISKDDWPPSSPDLNPLDYSIWGILETRVNTIKHQSIESLKATLKKEWESLSMDMVRATIDSWPSRLKALIKKRRTIRIEHIYINSIFS